MICPSCKTDLEGCETVTCNICETPHHLDCWNENKKCTRFGCGSKPLPTVVKKSREVIENQPVRNFFVGVWLTGCELSVFMIDFFAKCALFPFGFLRKEKIEKFGIDSWHPKFSAGIIEGIACIYLVEALIQFGQPLSKMGGIIKSGYILITILSILLVGANFFRSFLAVISSKEKSPTPPGPCATELGYALANEIPIKIKSLKKKINETHEELREKIIIYRLKSGS